MSELFPKPLHANKHCRHYSYKMGLNDDRGPTCAKGLDLASKPGAALVCMPDLGANLCAQREEFTEIERAAWEEWRNQSMARMILIMPLIPGSGAKRDEYWGKTGKFSCPACEVGNVRWTRAPNNGHIWASCSTPNCFSVIQ